MTDIALHVIPCVGVSQYPRYYRGTVQACSAMGISDLLCLSAQELTILEN